MKTSATPARILIVEDDPLLAQDTRLRLEILNYATAGIVSNGEDVLRQAAMLKPDLILMDIVLQGGMDGIEAAQQIRAQLDIPVVFITAHADEATLQRAIAAWPLAYLLKPLKEQELRLAIEIALYRHAMESRLRRAQEELELRVAERTVELETANRRLLEEISIHRQTNEALVESEERFRTLFESAPVGIATASADKHLNAVNPAFCRMLGYDERELLNKTFLDITYPEDAELSTKLADQAFRKEVSSYQIEKRYIKKNGDILWARLVASVTRDADGRFINYLSVAEDITATKHAEAQRLAHEIVQKDALVREVHHRIKNNLQGVVGLLRQQAAAHPEVRDILEQSISQMNSVALIYGLQGKAMPETLVLGEMIEAIGSATGELMGEAGSLLIEDSLAKPLRIRSSEAVPLALVLNELMLNAFKHRPTPPHQPVHVRFSGDETAAVVDITNPGHLEPTFDLGGGNGVGTGLGLVKALLPRQGARLQIFSGRDDRVHSRLELAPPVITIDLDTHTRSLE